jgi:small subunit ribosomal protein S20
MPTSASAKKRLRQNFARRDRNRAARASVRTQLRKVRQAVAEGDVEKSEAEFRNAVKCLDQAAAHNILHPTAAARAKSRLSKAIKAIKS